MNDQRFHQLDENEAAAVLCAGGVFRQTKVYQRDNRLYAGYGSGFIGLHANRGTSKPKVFLDSLELPDGVTAKPDKLGRLEIAR